MPKTKILAERFRDRVGREPVADDLDRANCRLAGKPGHLSCGWCLACDRPQFECGCRVRKTYLLGRSLP